MELASCLALYAFEHQPLHLVGLGGSSAENLAVIKLVARIGLDAIRVSSWLLN